MVTADPGVTAHWIIRLQAARSLVSLFQAACVTEAASKSRITMQTGSLWDVKLGITMETHLAPRHGPVFIILLAVAVNIDFRSGFW